jgi:hypothetical protein
MHTDNLKGMTRRLTISLPDDVAARIDREPNASAFIAELIRRVTRYEALRTYLRDELGVTEDGKARARERLRRAHLESGEPSKAALREGFWAEIDAASAEPTPKDEA